MLTGLVASIGTTISVFADHGDYAGDYGLVEKWPSGLEDVLTRVYIYINTFPSSQTVMNLRTTIESSSYHIIYIYIYNTSS